MSKIYIENPEEVLFIVGAYPYKTSKVKKISSLTGEVKIIWTFIFDFELHVDTVLVLCEYDNVNVVRHGNMTYVEVC